MGVVRMSEIEELKLVLFFIQTLFKNSAYVCVALRLKYMPYVLHDKGN